MKKEESAVPALRKLLQCDIEKKFAGIFIWIAFELQIFLRHPHIAIALEESNTGYELLLDCRVISWIRKERHASNTWILPY